MPTKSYTLRNVPSWLQDAANQSVAAQRRFWKESVDEAMKVVQEAGVEVVRPDKTPFREKVQPIYDSYKGTPIYTLIQEIQSVDP